MKHPLPPKNQAIFLNAAWFTLVGFILIFLGNQPLVFAQSFEKTKEIRLSRQNAIRLFSLKKDEKTSMVLTFDQAAKEVEMQVINHLNMGEKSGALAIRIFHNREEMKLLINRKERDGKLVYWIAILPASGEKAFKLEGDSEKEFVLVQVDKDLVVTQ